MSGLHRNLGEANQDAAAARILAGGADRDVAAMSGDLRAIRGEVGGLRGEVGDLRGEVNGLRGEVGDLRGEVGGLRGEVGDLRGEVGGLRGEVGDLRGEVGGLQTDLAAHRKATAASFNAQRQDFVDLRDHVDRGFIEMRGKFDAMAAGQQQIVNLLQTLIDHDEAS